MKFPAQYLITALAVSQSSAQLISFCTEENCETCPDSITTAGTDVVDDCVIYDTETVFGGQGFEDPGGEFLYEAFAKYSEPCGGDPGALMIRSPAVLTDGHCGNLVHYSNDAGCAATPIDLKETFMVQFCCGSGPCEVAGVPANRRRSLQHQRAASGATGGLYLSYENGTMIEPLVVGKPQQQQQQQETKKTKKTKRSCKDGYEEGSYSASGDWYLASFNSIAISDAVPASPTERTIHITWEHTFETSTSFSLTVGDPFGVISASVGFEFSDSTSTGVQYDFPVPPNQSGIIYFTPVFKCTRGTIKTCDGETLPEGESCTPYKNGGGQQEGEYTLVGVGRSS
ncbi:hypothetical protein GGS20DRAFT_581012 [Poronia punctata]|nr:hypothetical protein GGS20DRAFT_581012 [Poronia punctata]